jgi:isopenicillin N synthase-like dioxygenase
VKLDVVSFHHLNINDNAMVQTVKHALLQNGIIGVRDLPEFETKSKFYVDAARKFSSLDEKIKNCYAPNRDIGETEGYELGAEWFQNKDGVFQVDDKKSSFYAIVPDHVKNKWPTEVDLRSAYLDLGKLIFDTGKSILTMIGLNNEMGLKHSELNGCGRMLHYRKESDLTNENPFWCGAHFDHGLFTGLMPAYYFSDGIEIAEPEEAGLYIIPGNGEQFEKVNIPGKDILLFQVGEFGQLISNDEIKATKHLVIKVKGGIERYSFALFYSPNKNMMIESYSSLITDNRYRLNQVRRRLSYDQWEKASFDRYRAIKIE